MIKKIDQIRNIGLIGHSGCGKTSLAEAILFNSKSTNRLGRVDDGNSIMDFEPEEIKRKASLSTAFHPYKWKSREFNLVDTPGENDFLSDLPPPLFPSTPGMIGIFYTGGELISYRPYPG